MSAQPHPFSLRLAAAATALVMAGMLTACPAPAPSVRHAPLVAATESGAPTLSQAELDRFAGQLRLQYRLLDNRPGPHCRADQAGGACFQAALTLHSAEAFDHRQWTLHFSHVAPIQRSQSDEFEIVQLNGDLHELRPTARFRGFAAGEHKTIPFQAAFWLISHAELMPNYFLTAPGLMPRLLASSREQLHPETGLPYLPFVAPLQDRERQLKRTPTDETVPDDAEQLFARYQAWGAATMPAAGDLIPTPRQSQFGTGRVTLARGINLLKTDFAADAVQAALARLARLGVAQQADGMPLTLHRRPAGELPAEGYRLHITADLLRIEASDATGAFYGLQSLAALLQVTDKSVPIGHIEDAPRYPFRGLHIDVARNFHSKNLLLKLLDQMAAYKLNKLHLHLADDEGWRLEIPGLPELTEIGAFRCHDPDERHCLLPQLGSGPDRDSPVNGFYSRADYLEIVRAANARHIQVIPSLDMPGHARAAVRSMRARHDRLLAAGDPHAAREFLLDDEADRSQYESVQFYRDNTINICQESAYHFVDKILAEVATLHAAAGQPLTRFHIGADETPGAWTASPACQQYLVRHPEIGDRHALSQHFIARVAQLLTKRGIEFAAWSDGVEHLPANAVSGLRQANAWGVLAWNGHRSAHQLANAGWQVVVSSPDVTYFDFPYAADPEEPGYYWGTRSADTRKVFEFMPDNLPAHAAVWRDRENRPYRADDRADATTGHRPLREDVRFHGLQAQLWSETVRSDAQVEYLLFPRLLALAERAWHRADWELAYRHEGHEYRFGDASFSAKHATLRARDWQRFAGLLATREFAKLAHAGIAFRLPTVGARLEAGHLHARLPFVVHGDNASTTVTNALAIEYRVEGGRWQRYRQPVPVSGAVEVRAVLPDYGRAGRSLPVSSLGSGSQPAAPAHRATTTPTSADGDGFVASQE